MPEIRTTHTDAAEETSDSQILAACLDGDEDAREELAVRTDLIVRRLLLKSKQEAGELQALGAFDDLVQIIVIHAFKKLGQLENRTMGGYVNWLKKIVMTKRLDYMQSRGVRDAQFTDSLSIPRGDWEGAKTWEDLLEAPGPDPGATAAHADLVRGYEACIETLSAGEKAAITLWKTGATPAQIALRIGGAKSPQAVAAMLWRIREKIAERLRKEWP